MRITIFVALLLVACTSRAPPPEPAPVPPNGFQVVPIRIAPATDLANLLNDLLAEGRRIAPPWKRLPSIRADARTNSLLVKADEDDLPRILYLIERFDHKPPWP